MTTLRGSGCRDRINGASVKGDDWMHLGYLGSGTACEKAIEQFLVTYADVEITCPGCIEKLEVKDK